MRFIQLTRHDGQKIWVNVGKIESIVPYEAFTAVCFGLGDSVDVCESDEAILKVMRG